MDPLEDADPAAPCRHTDPVNGCECGARVAAWWAEVKRRLAEASPAYWAEAPEPVDRPGPVVAEAEVEEPELTLF